MTPATPFGRGSGTLWKSRESDFAGSPVPRMPPELAERLHGVLDDPDG